MESNEIYHDKSSSRRIIVLKKIGLLLLAALVASYIYISIHFILS